VDRRLVKEREAKIEALKARQKVLDKERKQAEKSADYDQVEKLEREIAICANKIKATLFKMGRYRYPKDQMIEYAPGQFMPANQYYWLLND